MKRRIVQFDSSRLILVDKSSSYIELNLPEVEENKCFLCTKTNAHDHDIIGKVKFEPGHKSYLVSLLENKKIATYSKAFRKQASEASSNNSKLEIIPVVKSNENHVIEKKQSHHVYPAIVPSESAGKHYFYGVHLHNHLLTLFVMNFS